jgi:hypothetical protein
MGPGARYLFTAASFLPLAGVLAMSAWSVARFADLGRAAGTAEIQQVVITIVLVSMLVAFLQIGLGIVVALHTAKRPDLSSTQKAVWTLACLFVGSFALPLFSLIVLPGAPRRP